MRRQVTQRNRRYQYRMIAVILSETKNLIQTLHGTCPATWCGIQSDVRLYDFRLIHVSLSHHLRDKIHSLSSHHIDSLHVHQHLWRSHDGHLIRFFVNIYSIMGHKFLSVCRDTEHLSSCRKTTHHKG